MRPVLKAGLLPVWRDRETVQIGIDPRRAVALTGMGPGALVLGLLDGSRDREQVIATAREHGVPEPVTEQIITLLAAADALDDYPAAALRALPDDRRRRMEAELATAAIARGHADAGAATLVRRDTACAQVYGPGRIASAIADILAAAGVGRVSVCSGGSPSSRPDLAILVGRPPAALPARLMRAGTAHLAVAAEEAIGVVGPLVRPGQTACLRCLDIIRSSRDPAWPLILAQLAGRAAEPPACDAALAAAVAAQAAAQALLFLDRAPAAGPAENGTLELVLPAWQWRRRTWPPHPACGCRNRRAVPVTARGGRQWDHE